MHAEALSQQHCKGIHQAIGKAPFVRAKKALAKIASIGKQETRKICIQHPAATHFVDKDCELVIFILNRIMLTMIEAKLNRTVDPSTFIAPHFIEHDVSPRDGHDWHPVPRTISPVIDVEPMGQRESNQLSTCIEIGSIKTMFSACNNADGLSQPNQKLSATSSDQAISTPLTQPINRLCCKIQALS